MTAVPPPPEPQPLPHKSTPSRADRIRLAANAVAEESDSDVLIFNGPLARDIDDDLIDLVRTRRHRPAVVIIIVTEGGNADCAFRIGRCLQDHYSEGGITALVGGYCKSAGTLLVITADDLAMWDHGELGPLDVQMQRADDWTLSSGLTVTSSLRAMQAQAQEMFRTTVLELRKKQLRGLYSAKTASDIAARITIGALQPIFQQIEAMHIGEASRALSIARFYGSRLDDVSGNLQEEALTRLLVGYPSHGYVIDRAEAEQLFYSVRKPTDAEIELLLALGTEARVPHAEPDHRYVCYLSDEVPDAPTPHHQPTGAGDNQIDDGRPAPGFTPEATGGDDPSPPEPDGPTLRNGAQRETSGA